MAMVGFFGLWFRNGATVTAFSFASFANRSTVAGAAANEASKYFKRHPVFGHRRSFQAATAGTSGIVHLKSTATAVSADLEKSLDVTHPAYEVVNKDVVEEYGAYCTMYRHKKSGAELLSVSNDDENKVFGITFRTPPEVSTRISPCSAGSFRLHHGHSEKLTDTFASSYDEFRTLRVSRISWSIPCCVEAASTKRRIRLFSFSRVVYRHF
jgi:hypothetical protein